jgi:beta-galactosidase
MRPSFDFPSRFLSGVNMTIISLYVVQLRVPGVARLLQVRCGSPVIMLSALLFCLAATGTASMGQTTRLAIGRETLSLDQGWRFHLGDIPPTDFKANGDEAEGGAKGASAWGAAAPKYDDKVWKVLDLPHDWVVEQPFDQRAVKNQGYRQRGIAWYRRQFMLDASDRGKHLELQFDGVSTHCTVWFNG